jgi:hypothetical protein
MRKQFHLSCYCISTGFVRNRHLSFGSSECPRIRGDLQAEGIAVKFWPFGVLVIVLVLLALLSGAALLGL